VADELRVIIFHLRIYTEPARPLAHRGAEKAPPDLDLPWATPPLIHPTKAVVDAANSRSGICQLILTSRQRRGGVWTFITPDSLFLIRRISDKIQGHRIFMTPRL
jgi:hypothetical protein